MPTIKISNPAGGTWTTSGNLTAATRYLAGAGTQSAALAFGGFSGSSTVRTTQKFNGSTWTTSGNLSATKQDLAGAGTQSAALAFGGVGTSYYGVAEKFNGSTWTTSGSLSVNKSTLAGAGTQSAALAFGGYTYLSSLTAVTEKFNGNTWSTSGNLSAAKQALAGAGTQGAAVAFGGIINSTYVNVTEKFNGSVWAASGNLSVAKKSLAGAGTQSAALAFGGVPDGGGRTSVTEKFNGSTWSTSGNLSAAKQGLAGAGTQGAAVAFGGEASTGTLSVTEKFVGGDPETIYFTETIVTDPTIGTLSSDEAGILYSLVAGTGDTDNASFSISNNNLNTSLSSFDYETKPSYSVRVQASNGTITYENVVTIQILNNTADDPATVTLTNPANGVWSIASGTVSPRKYLSGTGTESAALALGGDTYGGTANAGTLSEKYNGSAWSATSNLLASRSGHSSVGLQNAALIFGGYGGTAEKFNGSTWTSSSNLLGTSWYNSSGAGTQNAALAFGGGFASAQKFDGSTWSTSGTLNKSRQRAAGAGIQSAALAIGADSTGKSTEKFDGSTWSNSANLIEARGTNNGGAGTQNAGITWGGYWSSTYLSSTEKFNGSVWAAAYNTNGGRDSFGCAGSASDSALMFAGYNGFTHPSTSERFISGDPLPISFNEGALSSPTLCKFSTVELGMSYSLVAGTGDTDNASFSISNNNLNTSLSSFNYTNKSSYSVRVQASNGTITYENVVRINVIDLPDNFAPTDIILSSNSIAENNAVNAVVGTLSAIDPNVGDTSFTFSITGGADAAKFNISGNQLRASQAFNYESPIDANADNVYVVEITAQDAGGLSYAKTFNISVTNDASDDSIAAPNVAIIYIQSIGRYKFNLNTDPRTIPVLMAGSALPTNSVIRHTGNNKKYVKLEGAATAFGEIPVTPPASWNFSEEGISAWAVLQGF